MTSPYYQNPYGNFQTQALQAPSSWGSGTPSFPYPMSQGEELNKIEGRTGTATQQATNVLDVRNPLSSALANYQRSAGSIGGQAPSLRTNFQGASSFNRGLRGGLDYFGRLGMSEGVQNINLQRDTANRALSNSLGRTAGNEGLLAVLQNQNLIRSQLATNPLMAEAQRGTAQRAGQQVELDNAMNQMYNQARLAQYQAKIAGMQPGQNLLEILSSLQGQQRGVQSSEVQLGAKNYK